MAASVDAGGAPGLPPVAPLDDLVAQGEACHRQGRLAEAESWYRAVLVRAPAHFDALQMLGACQHQQDRNADAVVTLRAAIAVDPRVPAVHSNLGLALRRLGRFDEALASFAAAIALQPDFAQAHNNRGNVLRDLARHDEALACYDAALALRPGYAAALKNRGEALVALGRADVALADFERALAVDPADAGAHQRRANALAALGRREAALAGYARVLALDPAHFDALNNSGSVLLDLHRAREALPYLERAVALRPGEAGAQCNLAVALAELGRPDVALAAFDRALARLPDYPEALLGRGSLLQGLGRHQEAIASYARLLAVAPAHPFARGQLLHAKMLCCDWSGLAALAADLVADVRAGRAAAEPFGFQAIAESEADLRRCAEIFAAARFPAAPAPLWRGERWRNPRIRIGYLSGEFRTQATSLLLAGVLERHDRSRFELLALDNGFDDGSDLRRRVVAAFDEVVDIGAMGDAQAAALIRQRQVDILVNLNGYFGRGRQGVFAQRPCPIQVNYLGFPGTLGARYIDYLVADPRVVPEGSDAHYAERIVRLPDCYQANDPARAIAPHEPSRTEAGLPPAGFVFCCFNNNYKITPPVFAVWLRLLQRVPGSVLWLFEDNPAAIANLRAEAARAGVAPARLVAAPRRPPDQHLARHRLADLFLDTLPYNAHTTASDALWAGLPLVTCTGTTFPGRVATSLLHAAGLPDLVTPDLEAYEALAFALATDAPRLAAVRARLREQRASSALFDADRFRRHLETAYLAMWERWQRGEPPAAFAVAPPA